MKTLLMPRRGAVAAGGFILLVAAGLWLGERGANPPAAPPPEGVVRVQPAPLLAAPTAPASADVKPAPADAFVGRWRDGGTTVIIARIAPDRYDVRIMTEGAVETYDGSLADGRLQIARGIDGDWIQAIADRDCLRIGTAQTVCRT